jgi:hypothetical protein
MSIPSINLNESLIEHYQAEYRKNHCIFLPGFIAKAPLKNLLDKLEQTKFETKYEMEEENKFGKVLFVPQKAPVIFTFHLLLNNPKLFSVLQKITECEPIGNFVGRIHRSNEGERHEIDWHGDNSDNRLLAITLSLGTERYIGAQFQMRKTGSSIIDYEFGQLEAGDALIFKISPDLQHRLAPLEKGRRTVGVGWFRSQPDYEIFAKNYLKPF